MKQNGLWILGIIFVAIIIFALFFTFRNNDNDYKKKKLNSKGKCPFNKEKGIKKKLTGCPFSKVSHYSVEPSFEFKHLFPYLKACKASDEYLTTLASSMIKPITHDHLNSKIPAGYMTFGQFIDHDITFNQNGSLEEFDGTENTNFRSPHFDLDSVFSGGKHKNVYMYNGDYLVYDEENNDLARNHKGTAIIGDPRNDENLLIAQMQLLFIKFYNKVMKTASCHEEAKNIVRWTYQYIVVHDFLKKICGEKIVNYILRKRGKFYQPNYIDGFFMPHEFSIVAFRIGHAMILEQYQINDCKTLSLKQIFEERNHTIDWKYFFGESAQPGKKFAPHLANTLGDLPIDKPDGVDVNSLPLRNLKRGKQFKMACGQDMAHEMGIKYLSSKKLAEAYPELKNGSMHKYTPMWFYMLAESELNHDGERLGSLAAIIIAEVICGILQNDYGSYLYQKKFTPLAKNMHELCEYVNGA